MRTRTIELDETKLLADRLNRIVSGIAPNEPEKRFASTILPARQPIDKKHRLLQRLFIYLFFLRRSNANDCGVVDAARFVKSDTRTIFFFPIDIGRSNACRDGFYWQNQRSWQRVFPAIKIPPFYLTVLVSWIYLSAGKREEFRKRVRQKSSGLRNPLSETINFFLVSLEPACETVLYDRR